MPRNSRGRLWFSTEELNDHTVERGQYDGDYLIVAAGYLVGSVSRDAFRRGVWVPKRAGARVDTTYRRTARTKKEAIQRLLWHVHRHGIVSADAVLWEDVLQRRQEREAAEAASVLERPTPQTVSRENHDATCMWRVATPQTHVIASHCAGCGRFVAMDPTQWLDYHGRARLPKGIRDSARKLAADELALRRHMAGDRTPDSEES